jgi:Icc-related predicted phosphoesterase
MRIIAFSDTHGVHNKIEIPDGDILIFAGDMCNDGSYEQLIDFINWLKRLPHKEKVIIAGTHDVLFYKEPDNAKKLFKGIATYLQDSLTIVDGMKIYGSSWHSVSDRWAFNLPRGKESKEKWDMIPDDIDILITHTPPYSILDKTSRDRSVGCRDLYNTISNRLNLKYHIFGHIHYSHGNLINNNTEYVNGSIYCKRRMPTLGKPIILDYQ